MSHVSYTDKSRYPKFSRTNPSNGLLAAAVMGVGKHFGWSAINVLVADHHEATSWVSELESAASTPGSALFSTGIGRGGGLGWRPKKCTGRDWGMGSSTI